MALSAQFQRRYGILLGLGQQRDGCESKCESSKCESKLVDG